MIQLDTSWLQHVQKPARYTGGEYNSIVKDHSTVDITMALGFPDVYEVAMSHLGIKILYGLVNRREDAVAERVFAPWHDMEEEMRTVIISSHISSDLENLCDDIYMINDGKIILHEDMYKLLDLYGVIKANEEQYKNLKSDTNYKNIILCCEKEKYGYKCITNDRQYIVDSYPEIVIEKGNIDELIMVLAKGEKR